MNKFSPKRILVIKFQNIGDVLLTAPLISSLKKAFPAARVCSAVKSGTEAMLDEHPDLDALYVLPKIRSDENRIAFSMRYLRWIFALRREHFDLAINTTKGDHGIFLSWISGASTTISLINQKNIGKGIYRLITTPITPPPQAIHTVLRNLRLADPILEQKILKVTYLVDLATKNEVKSILNGHKIDWLKPIVHIHPTSRWMFKCWPDVFMAKTIDWLEQHNIQVVITASPERKELDRINNILSHCQSKPINLAGKLTLKQTAATSTLASLFFGVDSAPMHMAAAVNTPTIALFGPSSATNWGPWPNLPADGKKIENPYPNKNGIQRAGPHTIIQKGWFCVPCQKSGCEKSKKSACLDTLRPETVIPVLQQRLSL
jgi:heptosyltransferase-3